MKYILYLTIFILTVSCTTLKNPPVYHNNDESALVTVLKYNSFIDFGIADSSIFEIADIRAIFNLKDDQSPFDFWRSYVKNQSDLPVGKLHSNCRGYHTFKIDVEYINQEAKVYFYHDVPVTEIYFLELRNGKWIIINREFRKED